MRIGLLGDTHGHVPALEASIRGCREAGVDLIVHCGDFINTPFSPDPPDEMIALLRAEDVTAIYGNGEIYLRDWGTARWPATLAQRLRRPDPPNHFLPFVAAGQAALRTRFRMTLRRRGALGGVRQGRRERACAGTCKRPRTRHGGVQRGPTAQGFILKRVLSPDSLAWLRTLPGELTLDCARPHDVYVCHSMPGDPFSGIWDSAVRAGIFHGPHPAYAVEFTDDEIDAALSHVGDADLILCGHVPSPLVQRTPLPGGGFALVVRGVGWTQGEPDGRGWTIDYCVLDHVGPARLGSIAWEVHRHIRDFRPRDPSWTTDRAAAFAR